MPSYGSTSTIISRQGATPAAFGFDDETDPQGALEAFIDDLRSRASDEVDRYCNRSFGIQQSETETVRGNGTRQLTLRKYPVVAINEVRVGSSTLDPSNYQLEGSAMPGDDNAGIVERVDRRVWPERRITVDYDWGYQDPPGVVKSVVEDAVVEVLEKAVADRTSSGKSSESMDGYSVSWDNSDVQDFSVLTETAQARLDPLRRRGRA